MKAALVLTAGPGLWPRCWGRAGAMPVTEEPGWRTQGGHNTSQPEQLARPGQHCTLVNTTTYQHVLRSSSRFLFERNVHFVPLSHPERIAALLVLPRYLSLSADRAAVLRAPARPVLQVTAVSGWLQHWSHVSPWSPCPHVAFLSLNGCHLTSRVTGLRHKSIMGQQCQSQVIPGQLSQPPSVTQPRRAHGRVTR